MKISLKLLITVGFFICQFAWAQQFEMPEKEKIVPPPKVFESAEAHYNYLLKQAKGGTQHTALSLPDWSGIWEGGMLTATFFHGLTGAGAKAPLTPEYMQRYQEIQSYVSKHGRVEYDRLTHCEPSAYPRWLVEPYYREFVLKPETSWLMNDFMNETRRIYTDGRAHETLEGNTWLGDTIGFWDEDKLVMWTLGVKAADYMRGHAETSEEIQGIEVWHLVKGSSSESDKIIVQATMYDRLALTEPWNVALSYKKIDFVYRFRYWECATTNNAVQAADGSTTHILPGEEGFQD